MEALPPKELSRRELLRNVGLAGVAAANLGLLAALAEAPVRASLGATPALPDIQHDIGAFLAPVETIDGTAFRFGPVFTHFVTARLLRAPTRADRSVLGAALEEIETVYPFSPSGVFTIVAYGLPYFRLLPSNIVAAHIPRLVSQPERFALEEAVPAPTDVTVGGTIRKQRWSVPVRIESNDVLFTVRSDNLGNVGDVVTWLAGSNTLGGRRVASPRFAGLLSFDPPRVMFTQRGLPRRLAVQARLPFAARIHPQSPMWMGFADQQVSGSGPAAITTFAGNPSAKLTNAVRGDYFANASIQHLSHVILDLEQFYLADSSRERIGRPSLRAREGDHEDERDETFLERVQYMFRSTPPPSPGFADQITDGGGPAFLPNEFKGTGDATRGAQGIGTPNGEHRLGHLSALQRSSRAADGTPIHIRMDGPGYDGLDVPGGGALPKLQFSIFVPTAEFFAQMRSNQASRDLVTVHAVPDDDQGLERFLTTTRRQNFLVPPRSQRAFPLLELVPNTPARRRSGSRFV